MAACACCGNRVAEKRLTRTTITYEEDWELALCSGCFRDWDWAIWGYLSVAQDSPIEDPEPSCFRCGQDRAPQQVSVGYSGRTWYLPLCEPDTDAWATFLWSWLRLAEQTQRPFEWRSPVRLAEVAVPSRRTPEDLAASPVSDYVTTGFILGADAAGQLFDQGLDWHEVLAGLRNPIVVLDTDVAGVRSYLSPAATVLVRGHTVISVSRGLTHDHKASDEAMAYMLEPHAEERMALRHISIEQIRAVIDDRGKTVLPHATKPHLKIYCTPDIGVVVEPDTKRVVTVYWRAVQAAS